LSAGGIPLHPPGESDERLAALQAMYEPFLDALGEHFLMAVPALAGETGRPDNWQTSAWMRRVPELRRLAAKDEHFD
jgi:hypothetical protein